MSDAGVRDLVARAVGVARAAGASYADGRFLREEAESIDVQDERVEAVDRSTTAGIGVRVLVEGAWGFAGTSRLEPGDVERAALLAVEIARSSRPLLRAPVRFAHEDVRSARWATAIDEDPFAVPLGERIDLLLKATAGMRSVAGLAIAQGTMEAWHRTSLLLTSDGAAVEQTIVQAGAGIKAMAVGEREVQQRSYPCSFRGQFASRGYEAIREMDLPGNAPRIAEEAVALLHAPECPSERTTVVLGSSQVALQVHESVGHALELDRIMGMEAAYAGTSFVSPADRGTLRYGSDAVTITADATIPGGLGSYGFDDEGVEAQRVTLVDRGTLRGFITSRETAPIVGDERSNGTMRAYGWDVIPLIRMPNVNLEPGERTLDEILADVERGILMDTNLSWSIDDRRTNFQFGCEIAWEIERGKRGRILRNPTYAGRTLDLWRSCDAVGSEWSVWGVPNCGKGQPSQTARVGHGTAPARFRDVEVGVRA